MWLPKNIRSFWSERIFPCISYLNSSSTSSNISFNGCRPICSSEFLFFCFASFDHGYCQEISVHSGVHVKNLIDFFGGLFFRSPCRVTFLPKKFSCTKKWLRIFKFPTLAKEDLRKQRRIIEKRQHTTTLFHWFNFNGRSRWDWIHFA